MYLSVNRASTRESCAKVSTFQTNSPVLLLSTGRSNPPNLSPSESNVRHSSWAISHQKAHNHGNCCLTFDSCRPRREDQTNKCQRFKRTFLKGRARARPEASLARTASPMDQTAAGLLAALHDCRCTKVCWTLNPSIPRSRVCLYPVAKTQLDFFPLLQDVLETVVLVVHSVLKESNSRVADETRPMLHTSEESQETNCTRHKMRIENTCNEQGFCP